MENLDELTFLALERYFTVLEKVGYVKQGDVDKLILLTFLLDILELYSYYITEDDYNMINDIVVCLYSSSCLIPFTEYQKTSYPIDNYILNTPIRISEDYIVRHSLENDKRLVNN